MVYSFTHVTVISHQVTVVLEYRKSPKGVINIVEIFHKAMLLL